MWMAILSFPGTSFQTSDNFGRLNSKCIGLLFCPQSKFIGLRLLSLCQQYPNAYHSEQRTSQGRLLSPL